jgi:hypothetical protein
MIECTKQTCQDCPQVSNERLYKVNLFSMIVRVQPIVAAQEVGRVQISVCILSCSIRLIGQVVSPISVLLKMLHST